MPKRRQHPSRAKPNWIAQSTRVAPCAIIASGIDEFCQFLPGHGASRARDLVTLAVEPGPATPWQSVPRSPSPERCPNACTRASFVNKSIVSVSPQICRRLSFAVRPGARPLFVEANLARGQPIIFIPRVTVRIFLGFLVLKSARYWRICSRHYPGKLVVMRRCMQDNFDHRRTDSSLVVCDGNDRPILLLLVVMRDTLQIGISRRWCREHRKNRLVYCDSECTPVRSQVDYSSIIITKNPLRQLQTTTRIS